VLTKLEPKQLARLLLLVAEDAIRHPEPSAAGKPWSGRFAHAMIQHLTIAASESRRVDEEAALLAAAAALGKMLGGTQVRSVRLQAIDLERQDFAWLVALGLTETQFMQHVDALTSFHKQARPKPTDWPPAPRPVVAAERRADTPMRPVNEPPSSTPKPAAHPRQTNSAHPPWLIAGPTDVLGVATAVPPWRTGQKHADQAGSTPLDSLNDALGAAWEAFTAGETQKADETLAPLYAEFDSAWRPVAGPDGHILWNWIRLVRLIMSARDVTYGARRLAAVSVVELAARLDLDDEQREELLEEMVEVAMAGLRPTTDRPLSRSFATYAARLLAILGHEHLFAQLEYSNKERARARAAWSQEVPSLGLTERDRTADFYIAFEKAYREFRYRTAELARDYELSDRFPALIGQSLELLDSEEQAIAQEAIALLTDTLTVARSKKPIGVPTFRELDSSLSALIAEVSASGSLLLQETVFLGLRGGRAVLRDQIDRASRISHPDLAVELVSTKLPLSAHAAKPFRVRLRVRNFGNSVARDGWIRISSERLSFEQPTTRLDDLSPSTEYELLFAATIAQPATTANLDLAMSWTDDLGQEFSSVVSYLAEDQRASSWTTSDANPYSLSSIADPERLVGRGTELASLEGILRMSDSTYVTGLKRVGKSSLIRTLLETFRTEPGWAISRLELGTMLGGSKTPAAIALGIIDGIAEALTDAGFHVPDAGTTPVTDDYARIAGKWLRALDRALPDASKCRVVVAIDDFDGILPEFVDGEAGPGLFLFLRSLVDKPWLSLIFIGSEIMPTVIASQGYQLNQVRRTPLDHFQSQEDTSRLLRVPAGDRLDWSQESVEFTHHVSNGNPYYATLIAQRIWDTLRELDRSLVEPSDVVDAVTYIAQSEGPITFSHMWADDPTGMAPKSRRAMLSAALLLSIARCSPTAASEAHTNEVITIAQALVGDATADDLKPVLHRLVTRTIVTFRDESDSVAIRVPLFAEWLKSRGRRELEAEFEQFTRGGGAKRLIPAGDVVDLAQGLSYGGREVNAMELTAWIEQFSDDARDRYLAFLLLQRLIKEGYYTSAGIYRTILPKLKEAIRRIVPEIETSKGNYLLNVIIASHGREGSSVPATVTSLHQVMRIRKDNCVPIDEVPALAEGFRRPVILVLDDFVGTGQQLTRAVRSLCELMDQRGDWRDKSVLVIGAAISATQDIAGSEAFGGADVRTVIGQAVTSRLRALDPGAQIFDSEDDRARATDLVHVIGNSLVRNHPLGFGNQGLLVVLESNCPNNTLPVFWQAGTYAGRRWRALFPRVT
jgi:hypothetical protein